MAFTVVYCIRHVGPVVRNVLEDRRTIIIQVSYNPFAIVASLSRITTIYVTSSIGYEYATVSSFYCQDREFAVSRFVSSSPRRLTAKTDKQTVIDYEFSERILSPCDYIIKQTIVRFLICCVCACETRRIVNAFINNNRFHFILN